ncbi:MAG: hypothetical protein B6241_11635 [Spirochaetaceae bacterium 4572_59]|nr:MAG: hypothetical protein B6241_11635 [Spirochaetaceae bacterium 4572_59]
MIKAEIYLLMIILYPCVVFRCSPENVILEVVYKTIVAEGTFQMEQRLGIVEGYFSIFLLEPVYIGYNRELYN